MTGVVSDATSGPLHREFGGGHAPVNQLRAAPYNAAGSVAGLAPGGTHCEEPMVLPCKSAALGDVEPPD